MKASSTEKQECQVEDVAAYLDGELSGIALDTFEAHLQQCSDCSSALRVQRQLLCTLDIALNESGSFELPHNFTRVVAGRAENDLSVMRKKSERRRAFQLCVILALMSFALLGAASRTLVFDPIRSFFRVTAGLLNLLWQTAYEIGAGITVIVRVVARVAGPSSYGWLLLVGLAFIISISLLPLLIARYHRAQITE
jgi:predicted anti-sigma-YlaC factor YlaD